MKQNLKLPILSIILAGSTLVSLLAAHLAPGDRNYLPGYEKVRAALAADDLAVAQKATKALQNEGAALAQSESLEVARDQFGLLSAKAEKLAQGQSGFYVMHCPMAKKDWVQTSEPIANPYYGKAMSKCGELKKEES